MVGLHPNGRRAYGVAGGAFHVKIPIDGYFPDDPMQILPPLIEAYNRSGNRSVSAARGEPKFVRRYSNGLGRWATNSTS